MTSDAAPGAKMLREIYAQPAAWRSVTAAVPDLDVIGPVFDPPPDEVVFTGCGSSYYLAQAAAPVFQRVCRIRSTAVPCSEIILFPELALPEGRRVVLVTISRSGETSEAVAAAQTGSERRLTTLGIVCDPTSSLARLCQHTLAFAEAQEECVVMTGSFTTMLLGLQRCAGLLAGDRAYLSELAILPEVAGTLDYAATDEVAVVGRDPRHRQIVYLGAGPAFGLAEEAALKVKEASLTSSIAYHPLEFRHGPISVVDEQTLVVLLASHTARADETALIREVRAAGARVLAIAERGEGVCADHVVELRSGLGEYARQVLYLPPAHLLAYHRAIAKGLDPDAPQNLSKVVMLDWR
ncbi:MAG: SIS domain-containing protein [Chloroflexi bacterium]|nr:SIS domain-containing protein [Chloroflexota bacterium]